LPQETSNFMEPTQSIFVKALEHEKYREAVQLYIARWQKLDKEDTERKLYQGFINAAAALEMFSRGNYRIAAKLWQTYEKYRPLIGEAKEHLALLKKADDVLMTQKREYDVLRD